MGYILLFDIPKEKKYLQVKVNRWLHKINAKRIQYSIWESEDIDQFKKIASLIKEMGGEAVLLQKVLVEF
jgi:CRISPR/Cas system-associated endoribonuclease Cas2